MSTNRSLKKRESKNKSVVDALVTIIKAWKINPDNKVDFGVFVKEKRGKVGSFKQLK